MANVQSTQAFYSLTLQQPTAPTAAVLCSVIPGLKNIEQQIFEARGSRILLQRITAKDEVTNHECSTICEQDTFSAIRGVDAFRIPGTTTDTLVVSSDSGRIVLLSYDEQRNAFKQIKLETFGKSGVRRTIPGQYIASDPRGRAFMLASTEKNKVVWMVQRQVDGEVQISSPHEANQWATLCFDICALDTGWENPIFAAIESDYTEPESDPNWEVEKREMEKSVVYYTVDLGLNHVVKTWSTRCDATAHKLFGVPGGQDGPSGVLVCSEGRVTYHHDKNSSLSIRIPKRRRVIEDPKRERIITAGCLHVQRSRHEFFFLLQTDDGDVFKLTMTMAQDEQGRRTPDILEMTLKYYETLPVGKNILILRKGYLYVSAENGNSHVYYIQDLADDAAVEPFNTFSTADVNDDEDSDLYFTPRGLRYVQFVIDLPNTHPLMRSRVENLTGDDTPQIYAIQGTRNRSSFKTIRHGLDIKIFVSSPLPNVPFDSLWSLKTHSSHNDHKYLIISSNYGDRTIILEIGDDVEQAENTSFVTNRATISASLMGEDTHVQVHARGVRSILGSGAVNEWPSPAHTTVTAAATNEWQLLLGLSSSELVFFFMGDDGVLNQLQETPEMGGKITALAVAPTVRGQKQAKYAAVGTDDCTIRILSIDIESPLEQLSIQALSAVPRSIEIVDQIDPTSNSLVSHVHIGLQSGLYLRAVIDENGELGEVRTKFLGAHPVRLFPHRLADQNAILACCSRPWLGYNHPQTGLYTLAPLVTDRIDAASTFMSEHLQGLCAIQDANLSIFSVLSTEGRLSTSSVDLNYTPRSFARNPLSPVFYVAESDYGTPSKAILDQAEAAYEENTDKAEWSYHSFQGYLEEDDKSHIGQNGDSHLGLPRAAGNWASCIQAVDPINSATTFTHHFEDQEAALSVVCVPFESKQWEVYVAVGTGKNMNPSSGETAGGAIYIFRPQDEGRRLELVHKTKYDAPVYALHAFQGRLAVGLGSELFLFDLGMSALLRKSRGVVVPSQIVSIDSQGPRLVCGDVSESVTYVVFKRKHNRFIPFVDDVISRWTTSASMIDYETTAGGDKFGNLWIVRCPEQASKESDEEGIGGYIVNERAYLGGTPYRLELRAHFYTQDIPMSLQRTPLVAGGQEVLFWSGLQGTLGIMVPMVSREDVDFFSQLEMQMRSEDAPITGRDHLMYRGYYVPVKGVLDGDLCERFMQLSYDTKQKIAAEVDREVREIEKKIQDMRTRVAF